MSNVYEILGIFTLDAEAGHTAVNSMGIKEGGAVEGIKEVGGDI